ncbi:MAG: Flp pilus assembly complex ATPase component TadA [Nitrospirae bacterium]|nr:Flp pilus assembly complex ATPase component TadA [Nitrospirota bacterium]
MTTPSLKRRKLGELLIADGQLTEEQLNQALAYQHRHGGRLGAILLKMGFVTEEAMIKMLGSQMGIAHIEPSDIVIEQSVIKLVPEQMARRYQVLPVARKERVITLAMADPLNVFAIDAVRQATGLDVQPVVSREQEVLKAINRYYSITSSMERVVKTLDDQRTGQDRRSQSDRRSETSLDESYQVDELGDMTLIRELRSVVGELKAEDAPVIKFVNMMIAQAVREGTSDIHLEPDSDVLRIRYRVDGLLREVLTSPRHLQAGVTSRIKIMANIDIAEKRIPQDGAIQIKVGKKDLDIRVSTLPTVFGEKVVMRLLDKSNVLLGLEESGMAERHVVPFRKLIRRPYGLILVTGPTGSGKSTTLYGSLQEINSIDKNIVTVEDPVEYQLKIINQVQVNSKAGVTFASGLRSILRQDPDVIMIGEIRDKETATIAIQAALTGHLVFSTLHTNDAPTAATRLIDMGVEPFLIASTLSGVVAQRLVRRVCQRCKSPYEPQADLLKNLNLNGAQPSSLNGAQAGETFMHGKGCQECRQTGYAGRMGIYELLILDDALRTQIIARATAREIQIQAKKSGFMTLREDGLLKAAHGRTTLEEVLRVTQEIEE